MGDLLSDAARWLSGVLNTHVSQTVAYVRGEDRLTGVKATLGHTDFDQTDHDGTFVRTTSRDYLILATDLVFDGVASLPQRDDQIEETRGSKVYVYEVLAPGDEPPWRWSDWYHNTLRIHTKLLEVKDAT